MGTVQSFAYMFVTQGKLNDAINTPPPLVVRNVDKTVGGIASMLSLISIVIKCSKGYLVYA